MPFSYCFGENLALPLKDNPKSWKILSELEKLENQKIHALLLHCGYDDAMINKIEVSIQEVRAEYAKKYLSQKREQYFHAQELQNYRVGNENALDLIKRLLIKWNIEPTSIDITIKNIDEMHEGSPACVSHEFSHNDKNGIITGIEIITLTVAREFFQCTESRILYTIEHEIAHLLRGDAKIGATLRCFMDPDMREDKNSDENFNTKMNNLYLEWSRIKETIADSFCPLFCKESMLHALRTYSLCSCRFLLFLHVFSLSSYAKLPEQENGTHPSDAFRYTVLCKCNKTTWDIPWHQWQPYALKSWFNLIKRSRIHFRIHASIVGNVVF